VNNCEDRFMVQISEVSTAKQLEESRCPLLPVHEAIEGNYDEAYINRRTYNTKHTIERAQYDIQIHRNEAC